jgi:hypothetical protein
LPREKSGGANARVSFRVKNELRGRQLPFDLVHFESHRRAIEAGALKRVPSPRVRIR